MTVLSALIFLHTLISATTYAPDDGYVSFSSTDRTFVISSYGDGPLIASSSDGMDMSLSPAATSKPSMGPGGVMAIVKPTIVRKIQQSDPVHIDIEKIGIHASVQMVGVKPNGALAAPNNFVDVGGYAAGTVPGDIGSAIIDGHVDNGLALSGVFKHLTDAVVGDLISVTKRNGDLVRFIVTDIQSYDYENAPTDLIFNQRNGAFLKLITCGGNWMPHDRTYDRRIVVTAVLVE